MALERAQQSAAGAAGGPEALQQLRDPRRVVFCKRVAQLPGEPARGVEPAQLVAVRRREDRWRRERSQLVGDAAQGPLEAGARGLYPDVAGVLEPLGEPSIDAGHRARWPRSAAGV